MLLIDSRMEDKQNKFWVRIGITPRKFDMVTNKRNSKASNIQTYWQKTTWCNENAKVLVWKIEPVWLGHDLTIWYPIEGYLLKIVLYFLLLNHTFLCRIIRKCHQYISLNFLTYVLCTQQQTKSYSSYNISLPFFFILFFLENLRIQKKLE